jgi:hypothetical protein
MRRKLLTSSNVTDDEARLSCQNALAEVTRDRRQRNASLGAILFGCRSEASSAASGATDLLQ